MGLMIHWFYVASRVVVITGLVVVQAEEWGSSGAYL
jgi:hypothetical protein